MIDRFLNDAGKKLLLEALKQQTTLQGDESIAVTLADAIQLLELKPGEHIIRQNDFDNEMYFILAGRFSIVVNGREVAQRRPGQHVGEMALIDPKARRSATVVALEESVVAKIEEPKYSSIAERYPRLWRNIACELADRLRQRNELVPVRNPVSRVFIGSSSEALGVANEIQAGLSRSDYIVTVWTNQVFEASFTTIESLESTVHQADFALLVVSPDDKTTSRGTELASPRDNIILEIGLFMGALGRHRTFLVLPRGADIKIPTDLLGITPLTYKVGDAKDMPSLIAPVCTEFRKLADRVGPK